MAPQSVAVASGHKPHFGLFLLMAALMAALLAAKSGTRTDPIDTARPHQDPQERGAHYEDHVLASGRLLKEIRRGGGTLSHHPRVFVPQVEIPARYYAMPGGYRGGVVRDTTPHESAASTWPSVGKGGFRIPDALETRPDGSQVLYELKCPSPWLSFDRGSVWAAGMQTAFASQALAYFVWADEDRARRRIVYGFCGWIPPWAQAILEDLQRRYRGVLFVARATYLALDFPPAQRLAGKPAHEVVTAATLQALADLAPEEVTSAVFDLRKD